MRSALITGASRGIGRSIAIALARQGYGLTITARSQPDLEVVAAELRVAGASTVLPVAADLAYRSTLPGLVDAHASVFDTMNALILNAGVGTGGRFSDLRRARLDKTFDVNVVAAAVLIQHALPLLRQGATGTDGCSRIIGVSSVTGVRSEPGLVAYGASKAALISLLEGVSREESSNGVLATAIAPGYVETDMSAWIADVVPPATMIRVDDVVRVVEMVLALGPTATIDRVVLTRAATDGQRA